MSGFIVRTGVAWRVGAMATSGAAGVTEVRLRDLRAGSPVALIARVVAVERREVTRKADGSRRALLSGLLSDGTASVRFTWWDPPREGIERGTVLRAVHAEPREFRGRPEVVFSWRTRVEPASPLELPRVDSDEMPLRALKDLTPPEEGFRVEARVIRVRERSVTVGSDRRTVHEGLLADDSGAIAFSSWSDFGLTTGETIRVAGAYVGTFRNRPQLVLDERCVVTRVDRADLPSPAQVLEVAPAPIARVEEAGGGESVAVEGVVTGLLPSSGLIYRCPTCRRTIQKGVCRVHGAVEGFPDLAARFVLDDGSGSATVNAGREATERLWGVTLEELRTRLRELADPSGLEEQLFEALVGLRLRVRGPANRDDFGVSIYPESIERSEPTAPAVGLEARIR